MIWKMNELQKNIWENKYRFNNETFDEWLDRVSGGDQELRNLIKNRKFLFGGRILANRGLDKLGKKVTYSNCYVLSTDDSIEDIYKTCSDLARTFSYGGGVGIDISKLRPKDSKVNNAAKTTTGAVSFMDTFSNVTETICQNGRRGALMISMDCKHPDLEEFIDIKTDLDRVTKANISIRVTNDFMNAVINDLDWELKFETIHGEVIRKTVKAKELFHKLAKNNWDFAEPGILFWDNINDWNLLSEDKEFEYAGVNPCAEEPLPDGGSCLLGSFNLSEYVVDGEFDFESFENDIHIVVKAMNDVLDEGLPLHPLQVQRDTVGNYRQIGIGIMGLADMLIKLGIKYDTDEAIKLCDVIGFTLANKSIEKSALLAKEYGAYPKYKKDILDSEFLKQNTTDDVYELVKKYGLKNSQLLTSAPTGSLSTMLGISGGIEPIFSISYTRKTESLHNEDVYYKVYTPIAEEYMKKHDLKDEEELPDFFVTSQTINPFKRVDMQSVWQKHIDASISSTVNLPNETTVDLVEDLYKYAWKQNLKGLTIYRDGCKRSGVLTISDNNDEPTDELKRGEWSKLEDDIVYHKRKISIGCGKLSLFIGYSPSTNTIQDLYVKKKGSGGCDKLLETTVIAMSGMLRLGGNLDNITKAFEGVSTCPSFASSRGRGLILSKGNTCGSAILNAVKDFLKETQGELANSDKNVVKNNKVQKRELPTAKCPECGEPIAMIEGCQTCPSCGFSKCN